MTSLLKICIVAIVANLSRLSSALSSETYVDFKFKEAERVLADVHSQYVKSFAADAADNEDNWLGLQPSKGRDFFNASSPIAGSIADKTEELLSLLLQRHAKIVELSKLDNSSSSSSSATDGSSSLELENLIVDERCDGCSIELALDAREYRVMADVERNLTESLGMRVAELFNVSSLNEISSKNNTLSISSDVSIGNDVQFQRLYVNDLNVEYLNDEQFDVYKTLIDGVDQYFSLALSAKKIYVDDLEVESLCGLKATDWLRFDDADKTDLTSVDPKNLIVRNDTIFVDQSDVLFVKELNTREINDFDVRDDLFTLGRDQLVIDGNVTFEGIVRVRKLTANDINNTTAITLITKDTDQKLGDVFIDELDVNRIFVEKINGVPVDRAAKKSQVNVIKGMLTIGNLDISGELAIKDEVALPLGQSMQVYQTVLIDGNLFVRNVKLDSAEAISSPATIRIVDFDSTAKYNVRKILDNSWSRSRDQVFGEPVVFERGASVDRLAGPGLSVNGLRLEDAILADVAEIDAGGDGLTFDDVFFADGVARIGDSESDGGRFIEESAGVLTVSRSIRLRNLSAFNVMVDSYNGIPLKAVARGEGRGFSKFHGSAEFEVVRVGREMAVDHLMVNRLDGSELDVPPEKALMADARISLVENELRLGDTGGVTFKSLMVGELSGRDLEEALLAQRDKLRDFGSSSLTLNGDFLSVKGSLRVETINGRADQTGEVVASKLKSLPIEEAIERGGAKHLNIVKNLNSGSLNGWRVEEFFERVALTKSTEQILSSGALEVENARVGSLTTEFVNGINVTAELAFVDEPLIVNANITAFDELLVRGRIQTRTVQNEGVSKLKNKLQILTGATNYLTSLSVFGNVFWVDRPTELRSVGYLLKNSVTRNEDQILNGRLVFEGPTTIDSLHLVNEGDSMVERRISEIVADAALDDENSTTLLLDGTKLFKGRLSADRIEVKNDFNVQRINDYDVNDAIRQISPRFASYEPSVNDVGDSSTTTVFLEQVDIGSLITSNGIHGVVSDELDDYRRALTEGVRFERLVARSNLTLDKLDGLDFDDFERNRLSTTRYAEVYIDVEFAENVVALRDQSFVSLVNNVKITDVIVSSDDDQNVDGRVPNRISGRKIFESELFGVVGDVETDNKLGNFHVNLGELLDSVNFDSKTGEEGGTEIFGDLVFKSSVEALGNVEFKDQTNVSKVPQQQRNEDHQVALALKKVESSVDALLLPNSTSSSLDSGKLFHYVERSDDSRLARFAPTSRRDSKVDPASRLLQSVAYVVSCGGFTSLCAVEITSSRCDDCGDDSERPQKIFWRESDGDVNHELLRFDDLVVADVGAFVVDGRAYLMLAVFYDEKTKSHATTSLLYEINSLSSNVSANLIQFVRTDGARTIHVFESAYNAKVHAVIGCVKGKAESLLLRFDDESRQFRFVRSFATGGSRYVASISGSDGTFVILNNPDVEALQIFVYDPAFDNFYDYQNLYFESKTTGLHVLDDEDETLIVTTTKDGWLYIYEYMLYGKFKLKMSHWMEDVQVLTPFSHDDKNYLFIETKSNNSIFEIVQQEFISKQGK